MRGHGGLQISSEQKEVARSIEFPVEKLYRDTRAGFHLNHGSMFAGKHYGTC
jgi:hypothetical protein